MDFQKEGLGMKKLYAIGEALIDMTPMETGKGISEVSAFSPHVGGAPANVLGAYRKLGGDASLITQVGTDPFGDKIIDLLKEYGIEHDKVKRTDEACTSLAFVALKSDGSREFSFIRKPGADMLYKPEYIGPDWFSDGYALHFCSVDLGNFPMRDATEAAINAAGKKGLLISFDPNLRFNLWNSKEELYAAVRKFLGYADIVKISDEEIEFITGKNNIEDAAGELFGDYPDLSLIIYTEGKNGQRAYTRNNFARDTYSEKNAVDTTGAGDAFIGSFLYQLSEGNTGRDELAGLSSDKLRDMLHFSGMYAGKSVRKRGAIPSYPTKEEMELELRSRE